MGVLVELALGAAIVLAFLATFLYSLQDLASDQEAQHIANVFSDVHVAAERYLRDEYPRIALCFDTETLLNDWSTDPDGEWSTPFIAVPLYLGPVNHASYGGGGSPDFLGRSTGHGGGAYAPGPERCPNPGPAVAPHALRSLADVGLLPSGLLSLRYDVAQPGARRWGGRGLDFRFVIRFVNANTVDGPDAAVRLQIQGLVVARAEVGTFLPLGVAQRAARLTGLPDAGLISSTDTPGSHLITGVGGGWRMELCRANAVPTGVASVWSGSSALALCTGAPVPGQLPLRFYTSGGQEALTAALFQWSSSHASDPTGRTSSDDPSAGRLVGLVRHTPHEQFHQVLHADNVGVPRLNRMRTHLDMGGYGTPNSAFVSAVDADGDGLLDSRLHIIGDTRLLNADTTDDPPDDEYRPVVVHGMLHVTGGLQVGGQQLDQRLRAGDVYVMGSSVVGGADRQCPIDPGTGLVDTSADPACAGRTDVDTGMLAFPASRASHPNPENAGGGNHDLGPGDFRVRGLSEMIDRAFMVGGLEVTGGKVLLASDLAASYTRPEILVNMASLEMVSVASHAPTPATVHPDDDETEGRARDGDIHIVASEATGSVFATATRSVVLSPEGGVLIQPEADFRRGATVPTSGASPFVWVHNNPARYTVLSPDTVFLDVGDLAGGGDADTTRVAFAGGGALATGAFGGTVRGARVLTSALPDYHLVNWHPSGDGGTGPFDATYGCPPGMQLVAGIGPDRHVIPTGWRKERAPTAQERAAFPDLPIPAHPHLGLLNHGHPTQTYTFNWPISGTPFSVSGNLSVGFPTHPDPASHPAQTVSFVNPTVPFDPVLGGRNYIQVQHHDPLLGWRINPQDGTDDFDGSETGYDVFARNPTNPAVLDTPVTIPGHSSFTALYHCTFLQ